jgi:DNA-binding NarL/FixJ family response regulator
MEVSKMARARILLADDHETVREAFRRLLEPEFEIVGTASDGRELVASALELKPDAIVVDVGMPLFNGTEVGRELKPLLPFTKFIALALSEDWEIAAKSEKPWAAAYLLKKSAGSELVKAIREALNGKPYVTRAARGLVESSVPGSQMVPEKELTTRQREVLQLLSEGRTMKETAAFLHVTPRTIAFHKYRIMEEFGLKTNADLVRFAIREGVVSAS